MIIFLSYNPSSNLNPIVWLLYRSGFSQSPQGYFLPPDECHQPNKTMMLKGLMPEMRSTLVEV